MKVKKLLAVLMAGAVLGPLAGTASAEEVTVAVNNPGGSRTLFVEDLAGNPLTALDFGTSRSHPFRVRVVDEDMDPAGFQIVSSMTHLYLKTGEATYDYPTTIPSSGVSVDYSSTPLNLTDVSALVAPLFDVTGDLLCGVLGLILGAGGCVMEDLEGLLQTVDLPVDLNDLTNLPLLPQAGTTGAYTDPDYAGVGAGDPSKPGAFTATSIPLGGGSIVSDATVLGAVQAQLEAIVAALGADELIDVAVLTGAIQALLGPLFDTLGLLLVPTLQQVIDDLDATLVDLTGADLLGQSGDLRSYPILNVDIPSSAPAGDYEGTYSVTLVQM